MGEWIWGGVVCNNIVELARMADATQHMGLGWGGGSIASLNLHAGWCYATHGVGVGWGFNSIVKLACRLMLRNTWGWFDCGVGGVVASLNLHAWLMHVDATQHMGLGWGGVGWGWGRNSIVELAWVHLDYEWRDGNGSKKRQGTSKNVGNVW